jgi:hypothetical protein
MIRSIADRFVLSAPDSFYCRLFRTFTDHFVLLATISYFHRPYSYYRRPFRTFADQPFRTFADRNSVFRRPSFVHLSTEFRTIADHPMKILKAIQTDTAVFNRLNSLTKSLTLLTPQDFQQSWAEEGVQLERWPSTTLADLICPASPSALPVPIARATVRWSSETCRTVDSCLGPGAAVPLRPIDASHKSASARAEIWSFWSG